MIIYTGSHTCDMSLKQENIKEYIKENLKSNKNIVWTIIYEFTKEIFLRILLQEAKRDFRVKIKGNLDKN